MIIKLHFAGVIVTSAICARLTMRPHLNFGYDLTPHLNFGYDLIGEK